MSKTGKKKSMILPIVACILVAGVVGGTVYNRFFSSSSSSNSAETTTVRTYTLQKATYQDTISANGTVSSTNSTSVTSSLSYDVASIEVAVGDTVVEGQTIVTLDTTDLLTEIEREEKNYKEKVEQLRQDLDAATLNKNHAWNTYSEQKTKHDNGEITDAQFEEASDDFGAANQKLINAQYDYDNYVDTTLEDLYKKLEDCDVKATSSGTIVSLNATIGSPANSSGSSTAIATIADVNSLEVSVTLDEYDIQKVSKGMSAVITTDAVEGTFNGTVSATSISATTTGSGNQSSGYKVTVTFDEPNDSFLFGRCLSGSK